MNDDISRLGMGVMIGTLFGNEDSVNAFKSAVGKVITKLNLGPESEGLMFEFSDGSTLRLYDDGQSCCEHRYMVTADRLADFIGAKLIGAEVKDGPTTPGEYSDEHEIAFLDVQTDKGVFQIASHNEHNGYYGGFLIRAAAS